MKKREAIGKRSIDNQFCEGILYAIGDLEACEVWQIAATNDGYNNSKI